LGSNDINVLADTLTNWPSVGYLFRPNEYTSGVNTFPRRPHTPPTDKGNLSDEAVALLNAPVSSPAVSTMSALDGISIDPNMVDLPNHLVYQFRLIQQCGPSGNGYAKEVTTDLMPFNVPDLESNMRYQVPLKFECIFVLPCPQDVLGHSVTLEVTSSVESIQLEGKIVAMNDSHTLGVGMSDYFIPVEQGIYDTLTAQGESMIFDRWTPATGPLYDPNYWSCQYNRDPNFCDPNACTENSFPDLIIDTEAPDFMVRNDPNRMKPLKLIRVELGSPLPSVKIVDFGDLKGIGMSKWLTNDPILDINSDGVVNFTDLTSILNY
jgi:hypothetical protein